MRWAKKEKKKILLPNSVHTRPRQENSEKNSKKIEKIKKTCFRYYFLPKRDEIGREREKKNFYFRIPFILDSRKKISKKIVKKLKKLKIPLSDIIFSQNVMRQAEKEKKNFTSEFRSNPTRARKFRKKLQKNWKKPLSDINFSQNGMR